LREKGKFPPARARKGRDTAAHVCDCLHFLHRLQVSAEAKCPARLSLYSARTGNIIFVLFYHKYFVFYNIFVQLKQVQFVLYFSNIFKPFGSC